MSAIVNCNNLVKKFGQKEALKGVSFELNRGQIVGLLGPNGSGKTTLIKTAAGLLYPTEGELLIDGKTPSPETKKIVSYLPERSYLSHWMTAESAVDFFSDFYEDFDRIKAMSLIADLKIDSKQRMKAMSKGTREKMQLILVMSRAAELYLLDEPIGGVDPAAREYILNTIISNYSENATVVISTHLITDIEKVLDEVLLIYGGQIFKQASVDDIREEKGQSVDELFREVFKC